MNYIPLLSAMLHGFGGPVAKLWIEARQVVMGRLTRTLLFLTLAGAVLAGTGFVMFANSVRRLAPGEDERADGIVVLTGDEQRIATGVRLMVEGRAKRMLISGVNPQTRMPAELRQRLGGSDHARRAIIACCVDIGRAALNTSGNADEASAWARAHGFRSLIVVTSGYHLLRSLAEFSRTMPEIEIQGYPVMTSRSLRLDAWWRHWPTARLLAGEYVKLVRAVVVLGLSRLTAPEATRAEPGEDAAGPSASASRPLGQ